MSGQNLASESSRGDDVIIRINGMYYDIQALRRSIDNRSDTIKALKLRIELEEMIAAGPGVDHKWSNFNGIFDAPGRWS